MKFTDMLISYIMKGGIVSESRNIDIEMQIPESNITIKVKCEHLTVKVVENNTSQKLQPL